MADIPAALLPTLPLGGDEIVRARQAAGWVYPTVAQIGAFATAALAAQVTTLSATVVSQAQQIAALQGKPDPCVALSGALPVATLQIGSVDVPVPVAGLLATDRVAVEALADLPAGLALGAVRPTAAGVLTVQVIATAAVSLKSAIPLAVTALR